MTTVVNKTTQYIKILYIYITNYRDNFKGNIKYKHRIASNLVC